MQLFQTRAYHGFSFQDLADRVGLRKASLFHHFRSKDEVAVAVLQEADQQLRNWMEQLKGHSSLEQLEAFFLAFRFEHAHGERMCAVGSFAAGWDSLTPEVQAQVQRMAMHHHKWLADIIAQGRASGDFRDNGATAQAAAEYVLSAIQGAMLIGRFAVDKKLFDQVVEQIRDNLLASPEKKAEARQASRRVANIAQQFQSEILGHMPGRTGPILAST